MQTIEVPDRATDGARVSLYEANCYSFAGYVVNCSEHGTLPGTYTDRADAAEVRVGHWHLHEMSR